ncbi:MAG: energy-coupling factor transporter transmembrane component T [Filifactor alocis]|nr:energy-coupling factor transporter transmembrane component T [Filifactor alocis]
MKLDFRTKFLMTLVISTISISGNLQVKYPVVSFITSLLPFVLLLFEKRYKIFFEGLAALLLAFFMMIFLLDRYGGVLSVLTVFIAGVVIRMVPGVMTGYYALVSTTMSDLVEALRRWRLPDEIVIPVSVMFRFFYSTREDYASINDAMKMHSLVWKNLFRDPVRILEYKAVPLLMCSSKAADDVAVSAMTRGMVVGRQRSSISDTRLRIRDYAMMALLVVLSYFYVRSLYA